MAEAKNMVDVRAQLHALLQERLGMTQEAWRTAAENFRVRFYGANHRRLSFPEKLHKVVSSADLYPDVFWSDDGRSFAINRDGYQRHIMFVFFNQNQLTSFQSLISRYHFTTELSRDMLGGFPAAAERAQEFIFYSHPSFVREHHHLSSMIRPRKSARKGGHESNDAAAQAQQAENTDMTMDQEVSLFINTVDVSLALDFEPFL